MPRGFFYLVRLTTLEVLGIFGDNGVMGKEEIIELIESFDTAKVEKGKQALIEKFGDVYPKRPVAYLLFELGHLPHSTRNCVNHMGQYLEQLVRHWHKDLIDICKEHEKRGEYIDVDEEYFITHYSKKPLSKLIEEIEKKTGKVELINKIDRIREQWNISKHDMSPNIVNGKDMPRFSVSDVVEMVFEIIEIRDELNKISWYVRYYNQNKSPNYYVEGGEKDDVSWDF